MRRSRHDGGMKPTGREGTAESVGARGVPAEQKNEFGYGRILFTLLCGLFCVGSFVKFLHDGDMLRALLAVVTLLLVGIPGMLERFASLHISTSFYVFTLLYAIGSLLGDGYKFFHLTTWWDKLMHTSAGVVFAVVGASLPALLNKGDGGSVAMRAIFALCFSLAISVVWEFFEFGMDRIFGMDMQHDTLIPSIHSYLIGDGLGVVGSIEAIESVTVNGAALGGYIDIGLIDTMFDMLFEGLGALIYTIAMFFDRGKHPAFVFKNDLRHPAQSPDRLSLNSDEK